MDRMQPSRDQSIVNSNRKTLAGPSLLHDFVSTKNLNKIAIDFLFADGQRRELDYGSLHHLSDALAKRIRSKIRSSEDCQQIIPVIIQQCPELYISWLAVLKAGAGFCPVAHDVPAERLRFIIGDVAASLVLTLPEHLAKIEPLLGNVPHLAVSTQDLQDDLVQSGDKSKGREPSPIVGPHVSAYVMYTSGSTGLPKGVRVSHKSVSQSILAHDEHIPTFKRFLQFASPTFDVSIFEVFFPLFRGQTLVSCEREKMLADLPETIRALNADAAELTPTVAGTLLRTRVAAPCLKILLTIGEMLTQPVVSEFGGSDQRDSMLFAMYGPTEASIHCTICPKLSSTDSVRTIGKPLSTVTAIILRESYDSRIPTVAAIEESGELAIAGQLADEYINRPDQTEAAFVEFPELGTIYRTGDRAICYPDGRLEILGRIGTGQVKIRGQRVELGEIERIASKVASVRLAIATVLDGIVILFCAIDEPVQVDDVHAVCKSWLPSFMRPGEILMLEKDVPRLPSGKVDRKALEEDYKSQKRVNRQSEALFENDSERQIALVFEEELSCTIYRSTSLWSAGLDSLKAIKIVSRLRKHFQSVNVKLVLDSANIGELVAKLEHASKILKHGPFALSYQSKTEWHNVRSLTQELLENLGISENVAHILPCSPMQIAMLGETSTISTLNFNEIVLKTRPGISFDDLWNSLQLVAEKNDILKSGFLSTGSNDMPFVQIVWQSLDIMPLDMLHPIRLESATRVDADAHFIVRIHHALYDGWSWDLVMDDLNSILSGKNARPRQSFQQYSSYQQFQSGLCEQEELSYWRESLQNTAFTPFPSLASTVDIQSEKQSFKRSLRSSTADISNISRTNKFSPQSMFEAAWVLLLSAYTGQSEVTIGVVSSGRHLPINDVENIIGPCLNTFPVAFNLDKIHSIHDIVNYAQRQHLNGLKPTNTSLRQIKKALNLDPSVRLFDTLFVFHPDHRTNERNWSHVAVADISDTLDYAVVLEIEFRNDKAMTKLTVDSSLIPGKQAEILLSVFDSMVAQMINHLEDDLECLWEGTEIDKRSAANEDFASFENSFDLTTTISRLARECPSRTAVEFVDDFEPLSNRLKKQTLSYGELYFKARSLSLHLRRDYGSLVNKLICVMCEKSLDTYTMILAVIMTGAGYMCIDPKTPIDRIKQITQQATPRIIVVDSTFQRSQLERNRSEVLIMRELLVDYTIDLLDNPDLRTEEDLAYAVFTSGSTGVPKGVLLSRKNILSNLRCLSSIYEGIPGQDRLLQACSLAFDVSAFEIFWTWHMGMTLCSGSNDIIFRDLSRFIDLVGVTHLSMTPSVAALVNPDKTPNVKILVTAGEPMNAKVFSDWAGRGLYQGYGPSETTNVSNIRPKVAATDAMNNVGPPLPSTSVYVCQRRPATQQISESVQNPAKLSDFKILPIGAVGEIWLGGHQVAKGYTDSELTDSSFLNHPRLGRLYRSGDIGRLLADHTLAIIGREDDQVKLRGQRIELGDINATLASADSVNDAVSLINTGESGRTRLVSFWTSSEPILPMTLPQSTKALYQLLRSKLPGYMIPDFIVSVDRIPLTRQGKIDKRVLTHHLESFTPAQLQPCSRDSQDNHDTTALSQLEEQIANIISRIIQVPRDSIFRTSSFYSLGLDSITAIHLSHELRNLGYLKADVRTILYHSSIGQLLPVLQSPPDHEKTIRELTHPSTVFLPEAKAEIVRGCRAIGLAVAKILPCTALQIAMLASTQVSNMEAYCNTLELEIRGDLNQLKMAWVAMTRRHELLRTRFLATNDRECPYIQVVLHQVKIPWNGEKLDIAVNTDTESLLKSPYSFHVANHKNTMPRLRLTIHHALYDAEAMSTLLTEVQDVYLQKDLPPSVSFDVYLQYMLKINSQEADGFWKEYLAGFRGSRLIPLLKHSSVEPHDHPSKSYTLNLQAKRTELEISARECSVNIQSILQSALTRLLWHYVHETDICFGNVFSGRNLPIENIARLVGPCFNTLPVRVAIDEKASNQDLCRYLHHNNLDAMPLQPSSLRRIQKQNVADGGPLFDTLLLFQQTNLELNSDIWVLREDSGDMDFPLIFEVFTIETNNQCVLKIHSKILENTEMIQLANDFDQLLSHCVKFSHARAADFSFLKIPESAFKIPKSTNLFTSQRVATKPDQIVTNNNLTGAEFQVRSILAKFSDIDPSRIFRTTSVFQLGFDSINAVQIAAELRKRNYQISGSDIIEYSTLARIASHCETSKSVVPNISPKFDIDAFSDRVSNQIPAASGILDRKIDTIRPCTAVQRGILAHFTNSKGKLYFNSITFKLQSHVSIERLKIAWETATKRHEMLRTGFIEIEDITSPFAMVTYAPEIFELPWSVIDKSSIVHGTHSDVFACKCAQELARPPWQLRIHQGKDVTLEISMLHALYDAQSLDILLGDVAAIYDGFQLPQTIPLSPVISELKVLAEQKDAEWFWKGAGKGTQMAKFPDLRVHQQQSLGNTLVVAGKSDLSLREIEKKCAELGVTLQAVGQAAWAKILAEYSSQDRVTFGLVLSGRILDNDGYNRAVFPCINTVPCTIQLGESPEQLLRQITQFNAGIMRYQHTPLTSIKRWWNSDQELFDTVFVLQKYDSKNNTNTLWNIVDDQASTEYVISVEMIPNDSENTLKHQLSFSADFMPIDAAYTILEQFNAFVISLLNDKFIFTTAQRDQMLSIVSPKEERIPGDVGLLHELIGVSVDKHPDKIALEYVTSIENEEIEKKIWTYSELDLESNRIAQMILQQEVEIGDIVAVCFEKCPEAYFSILGVLKAGCAYVAIDPGAPEARRAFILEDSNAKVVLTTKDKAASFERIQTPFLLVNDQKIMANFSTKKPFLVKAVTPQHICYCLYTSGTTGTPKGCLISHDSAVQAMLSFQRIFKGYWDERSRWLQFASFHFDVSVLEQFWSWSVGICVTSVPREILFEDLSGTISALNITHLDLTPSLARLLTPEDVPSLCNGVFIVGGEQVSQDILDIWGDSGCLYNFYGPSEVTIGCTVHKRVPKTAKPTNIGQPWDNVGAFVLDPKSQRPVLRGVVGELCLSGPLVGRGYLNRPDFTAEKFIVLDDYNARVYRTGDLVRLLHDNSFEFLGRIDDQVKLRGQRLEIGEINHCISAAAQKIKDVTTMVLKHPQQEKEQLVAFFSTAKRHSQSQATAFTFETETRQLISTIRGHCVTALPGYMVPTLFLGVSSMPLSTNNKIEHKTLKNMFEDLTIGDVQSYSRVEPEGEVSEDPSKLKVIIEIVASYLKMSPGLISPNSRLFELGFDSVSVVGLAQTFRRRGFKDANVAMFMKNSVLKDLSNILHTQSESTISASKEISIAEEKIKTFADTYRGGILELLGQDEANIENIAPCTPLQEAMVAKAMNGDTENYAYFTQFIFEVNKSVNLNRLANAWKRTQETTGILRTYFVPTPGGFAQTVLRDCESGVLGSTNSPTQTFKEWLKHAQQLSKALPWKVQITPTWGKTYMSFFIFHGLYDGTSLPFLLEDVAEAYQNHKYRTQNRPEFYQLLSRGPLSCSGNAKLFWSSRGVRWKRLNLKRKYSSSTSFSKSVSFRKLLPDLNLAKVCRRLNVTVPAAFQAAWLFTLEQKYGVVPTIGVVVSGRALTAENVEKVIGPMFNTIPFDVSPLLERSSLLDLVVECHRFNGEALEFQSTPLRDIAKWTNQDLREGPFDNLFVFQKESKPINEHKLWRQAGSESTPDYPLNLEIEQKADGSFIVTMVTDPEFLNVNDIRDLTEEFVHILNEIAVDKKVELSSAFLYHRLGIMQQQAIEASMKKVTKRDKNEASRLKLTEIESVIRNVLAKMAHINPMSIDPIRETIFELGLDSIDALRIAAQLRQLDIQISVPTIMRYSTVRGMAQRASLVEKKRDAVQSRNDSSPFKKMQRQYTEALREQNVNLTDVERILPVTSMQEGLLINYQNYYNVMCFTLEENVDLQRLIQAWQKVIQSQSILRTQFVAIENLKLHDSFLQVVVQDCAGFDDEVVITTNREDSKDLPNHIRHQVLEAGLRGQRLRLVITQDVNGSRRMFLGLPHAMYDAWSLNLLHQRVRAAYIEGENFEVARSQKESMEYEEHLYDALKQSRSPASKAFWTKLVNSARPSNVESSSTYSRGTSSQLLQSASKLSMGQILRFCQKQGVTLQSLGITCWTITLAHILKQVDVCFGTVLSGRTTHGSDQMVFPTFNTVIFRSQVEHDLSRREMLKRTHELAIQISEHQHFPLKDVLKLARAQNSDSALFNTLFTFQKLPGNLPSNTDVYHEVNVSDGLNNPPYAINIEVEGRDNQLWWTVAVQEGVFAEKTMQQILENLENVLENLLREPNKTVTVQKGNLLSLCGLPFIEVVDISDPPWSQSHHVGHISLEQNDDNEWTEKEAIIRDILATISSTEIKQIKKATSIYNLGLDSISAIKMPALLRKQGLKLSVNQIITLQSVEKMAEAAEQVNDSQIRRDPSSGPAPKNKSLIDPQSLRDFGMDEDDVESVLPTTAGQDFMLDMWTASSGRLFYSTFWFKISGHSEPAFENAMKMLQEETPLLRTTFIQYAEENHIRTLQIIFNPEASKKYSMPWSYEFQYIGQEMLLKLKIHHALYDAVSLRLLTAQLEKLCSIENIRSSLNTDFQPFVSMTSMLDEKPILERKQFWRRHLSHSTDFKKISRGTFESLRVEHFQADVIETSDFDQVLRRHGISLQAIFFAACAIVYAARLLHRGKGKEISNHTWSSSSVEDDTTNEVVLGIYLANRSLDIDDLPNLAAPTFNILPLKIPVSSAPNSLYATAEQVQADLATISKAANCGVSMREIYEWTGLRVDCFVNFLKLPEDSHDEEDAEDQERFKIIHASQDLKDKAGSFAKYVPSPYTTPPAAELTKPATEWCLPSIDIEAKVEISGPDGRQSLGIGVFAPEDMLDHDGVDEVIGMLKAELMHALGMEV